MNVPALTGEGTLEPEQQIAAPRTAGPQSFAYLVVVARVTELEDTLTHYLHLKLRIIWFIYNRNVKSALEV